ncbi:MAG: lysylphosphatidylglycerol synthase domain-containing protein [Zhengella sp.]|uniref:lysylphosphatidylglycerol synthase domain-containing protein n=1 Tax=Zhengella sp. TaxID=2282762 RepID=UPI001D211AE3|nr:UPF0104 family protein [Notoacmeibacter sp.]MCC0026129.1 UPF0104 family protein [Brucellaceae bacterium]
MSWRRLLLNGLVGAAAALAVYFIVRTIRRHGLETVLDALARMPAVNLAAAGGFAAASYLCLSGFDYFGARYVGRPLSWPRALLGSFSSLSIGHNVGFAGLSSGGLRYYFYSHWGMRASDVARLVVFSGVGVTIGISVIAGAGLLLYPRQAESLIGPNRAAILAIAVLCLVWPWLYLLATMRFRRSLRIWKWHVALPAPRLALWQILIGSANFACVAGCLHQLINGLKATPYFEVLAVYALSQAAALVSHVPGGLGVLEASVLFLLPGVLSLAAVIAFRIVYFFIPLPFGLAALGFTALFRR